MVRTAGNKTDKPVKKYLLIIRLSHFLYLKPEPLS